MLFQGGIADRTATVKQFCGRSAALIASCRGLPGHRVRRLSVRKFPDACSNGGRRWLHWITSAEPVNDKPNSQEVGRKRTEPHARQLATGMYSGG